MSIDKRAFMIRTRLSGRTIDRRLQECRQKYGHDANTYVSHEQFRTFLELPFDAAYDAEPFDYQQAEKTPAQMADWNTWVEQYLMLSALNRERFSLQPGNRYRVLYQLAHRYNRRVDSVFLGYASEWKLTTIFEQPELIHRPQIRELHEGGDMRFIVERVPVLTLNIPLALIVECEWLGSVEPVID
jgi:hypothetical protein